MLRESLETLQGLRTQRRRSWPNSLGEEVLRLLLQFQVENEDLQAKLAVQNKPQLEPEIPPTPSGNTASEVVKGTTTARPLEGVTKLKQTPATNMLKYPSNCGFFQLPADVDSTTMTPEQIEYFLYLKATCPDALTFDKDGAISYGSIPAMLIKFMFKPDGITPESKRFLNSFLWTFDYFMDPTNLLQIVIANYRATHLPSCNPESASSIRHKNIGVLTAWISTQYEELVVLQSWVKLFNKFIDFLKGGPSVDDAKYSAWLKKTWNVQEEKHKETAVICTIISTPSPERPPTKLLEIPPDIMAKQLTFIEQAILQATGMKEYRCWGSKKFNQEVDCPNINASISRFNDNSFLVATTALTTDSAKDCAKTIGYWLDVAKELETLCNFQSIMQIYLGLVFNPVQRVENAWKMLAPKHTEYFHHIGTLMSQQSNYEHYRKKVNSLSKVNPFIPLQAVILKDLVFLDEVSTIFTQEYLLQKQQQLLEKEQQMKQQQHAAEISEGVPVSAAADEADDAKSESDNIASTGSSSGTAATIPSFGSTLSSSSPDTEKKEDTEKPDDGTSPALGEKKRTRIKKVKSIKKGSVRVKKPVALEDQDSSESQEPASSTSTSSPGTSTASSMTSSTPTTSTASISSLSSSATSESTSPFATFQSTIFVPTKEPHTIINWGKLDILGQTLEMLRSARRLTYHIKEDPAVQQFLIHERSGILTEKELYAASTSLKELKGTKKKVSRTSTKTLTTKEKKRKTSSKDKSNAVSSTSTSTANTTPAPTPAPTSSPSSPGVTTPAKTQKSAPIVQPLPPAKTPSPSNGERRVPGTRKMRKVESFSSLAVSSASFSASMGIATPHHVMTPHTPVPTQPEQAVPLTPAPSARDSSGVTASPAAQAPVPSPPSPPTTTAQQSTHTVTNTTTPTTEPEKSVDSVSATNITITAASSENLKKSRKLKKSRDEQNEQAVTEKTAENKDAPAPKHESAESSPQKQIKYALKRSQTEGSAIEAQEREKNNHNVSGAKSRDGSPAKLTNSGHHATSQFSSTQEGGQRTLKRDSTGGRRPPSTALSPSQTAFGTSAATTSPTTTTTATISMSGNSTAAANHGSGDRPPSRKTSVVSTSSSPVAAPEPAQEDLGVSAVARARAQFMKQAQAQQAPEPVKSKQPIVIPKASRRNLLAGENQTEDEHLNTNTSSKNSSPQRSRASSTTSSPVPTPSQIAEKLPSSEDLEKAPNLEDELMSQMAELDATLSMYT